MTFVTGSNPEDLHCLWVVCSKSLRTGATYRGDRAMPMEQAEEWANELSKRPYNTQSEYWIEPALA